jgi:hypothetical protein
MLADPRLQQPEAQVLRLNAVGAQVENTIKQNPDNHKSLQLPIIQSKLALDCGEAIFPGLGENENMSDGFHDPRRVRPLRDNCILIQWMGS